MHTLISLKSLGRNRKQGEEVLTPKEYLQQIYKIDEEIKAKVNEYDKSHIVNLSASKLKQIMVDSSQVSNPTEEIVFKRYEYGNDILNKANELLDLKIKISGEIDVLENRVYRVILRERYINSKSWKQISKDLHYDQTYVYEIHGKALEYFKECHPDKEWTVTT